MAAHNRRSSHTLLFILFSFSFFFFLSVLCQYQDQRDYMLKLMKAITPIPSTWSANTTICNWTGITCNDGLIDGIKLRSMSLRGVLPLGLNDTLFSITKLDLSNNSLSGPLPSLANLNSLQYVSLKDNSFTSIPAGCFRGLTGLQMLYLSNNVNLTPWKFPTDLTESPALGFLDLRATNLVGSIPNIFHSLQNLYAIGLSNNSLSGVLPMSLARSKINQLVLDGQSNAKLSGTIEVLSSMTYLSYVWLQGNRFEGPIPELSNCPDLKELYLGDNQLTGLVPPSLMNLSRLQVVSLHNNWLQGPLPVFNDSVEVSLGGFNTTNSFCLDHAGPCDQRVNTLLAIAAAFGYPLPLARSWKGNNPCKGGWRFIMCDESNNIVSVNFSGLNLRGKISAAFANLTGLQKLYLNGNNLQGSVPESLASLPQLQVLDVSYNNLSGNIPRFPHQVQFNFTGNALLQHSRPSEVTPWIAGASAAGAGVIVMFVIIVYSMMFKKSRTHIDQSVEDFIKSYEFLVPKRYSYSEVKKMTNSFRDKLGQGGYGTVFKATLTDGRQVAVKVLSESKGSGEEFINEVASISRTSHVNILSLLGFCFEINRRALIYEFMPNGSLDNFIYGKRSPIAICDLEWSTLYKIAIGVARGLEYLHQGCSTRILHLDIKPQNILLDEDFCPKICDFGLAKICRKKESIVSVLGPRGTIGYIAPEVFSRAYGGVSHKSDVYSYGMLILDIVGGRENCYNESDTSDMYFPDWIYKDLELEQGNISARCLVSTDEENDMVMKIILVSLWCIQQNPSDRPSMSKVVEMLEGPLESLSHPPKPVMISPERPLLQSSIISYNSTYDTNSITELENGSIK